MQRDITGLTTQYYGVSQEQTTFNTTVPNHVLGEKDCLNQYLGICTNNQAEGGWPSIQPLVRRFDASECAGKLIGHYQYIPEVAPFKIYFTHCCYTK